MTLVWKSGLNLQSPASNDPLLDLNTQPSLDLQFATGKTLDDRVSGFPLVNHQRDASSGKSAGTYVGSDGLIKTSPVNLLTYSEQFDQWTIGNNSSVTPNQSVAPDGTNTADRVQHIGLGSSWVGQNVLTIGTEYTATVYAKAVTPGTNDQFTFSIGGNVISDTKTSTSEWQRFTWTATATTGTFYINNADDSFNTDVYFWGAQLEEGSTVNTYVTTTNLPSGAPRFDHDPATGESLGLLIEESRTNDAFYSNDFTQWVTTATGGVNPAPVLVPASGVSPSGLTDATEITYPAVSVANSYSIIYLRPGTSGNTQYVFSAYLKGTVGGETIYLMSSPDGVSWASQSFTLTTDWERCVFPHTTLGTNSYFQIGVDLRDGAQSGQPAQVISVWGAQVEEGSFPTSYIPTTGTIVTRAADVASITGTNFSSWYNQSEGTVFAEATGEGARIVGINDGTSSNRHEIFLSPGNVSCYQVRAGINEVNIPKPKESKSSFAYKTNDYSFTSGGSSVVTDTSATPPTVDQMNIGCWFDDTAQLNGHISRLAYYPYRLADATLQEITS
jgi:hypothetical protein